MSNLKRLPQVSNVNYTKSHTDAKSVCLNSDSGGGKNSNKLKQRTMSRNVGIQIATYNIRTMSKIDHLTRLEEELKLCERRLPGKKNMEYGRMFWSKDTCYTRIMLAITVDRGV